ncbi:MAG: GNAT family N-acetyltransferase [Candidatus Krumholzibacteria bacterium]|nr:GNAT family N-acetyltransferase [Candidatus Krumholzibacteria bacterium]
MSTASRVAIRQAAVGDVPLLLRMIGELAEFERIPHEVVATEEIVRESLFGGDPAAEALLAECDGKPAGFVIHFRNYSTFVGRAGLYIEDLYVRPEFRGLGVGRALFARCAEIARERNLGRVEWAVLEWNPAREFYEHFGARAMDDWVLYRLSGNALRSLGGS